MSNHALTTQLLEWIGNKPRNYSETMEAWRTSCPRLTIFEDAVSEGLLERVPGDSMKNAQVRLTEAGRARLSGRLPGR
jgi:hypothetical protein